jgi:hypothetical protein
MAVLTAGALIYLFFRPALPILRWLNDGSGTLQLSAPLARLFGSLPSFAHTFGFILFLTALLEFRRGRVLMVCALWLSLEAAFEVGQHGAVSPVFTGFLASDFFIQRALAAYFLNGVFDITDLFCVALGAGAALGTFFLLARKGGTTCSRKDGE